MKHAAPRDAAASASSRDRLRAISKAVLGNQDRLEVAVAIARAPGGVVNATELSRELGLAVNRVSAQLKTFASVDLLTALPVTERTHWYERRPSVFWDLCLALREDWSR